MEWKEVIATDYCYKVADGTHDSPKRQNKGRFLITSKHIKGPSIDFDNAYYISEDDYQKIIKRSKIDKWDVIVSMIGEYCGFCYLEDSDFTDYAVKNVGILKVGERIKSLWLYYYLNSPDGRNQLKNTRAGSSQPYISLGSLRNLLIPEPPREVMESIVTILSSLDRKIELNNKINADLEEMAQVIFKNWFVDFEPFKNGKFVDSELGMIPEGWKVGTLGEFCKCLLGGTPSRSKEEYWNGEVNWINSGEINKFRILEASEKITELGLAKSATKLLPKKTTVLAITGATLGQVSLLEIDTCANQSVIGVLENTEVPYEYIYPFIKDRIEMLIQHQTGGAQQHINKDNVESLIFLLPAINVLEDYISLVSPMYKRIESQCFENLYLSTLRDTLLPRLMSGELEVPE